MKVPRVRTQFTIAHDVLDLLNKESERLSVSRSVIIDMLVRKHIKGDGNKYKNIDIKLKPKFLK